MEPRFVQIVNGWAAIAQHWAVFGSTKEEAATKFQEAQKRHQEIIARPEPRQSAA